MLKLWFRVGFGHLKGSDKNMYTFLMRPLQPGHLKQHKLLLTNKLCQKYVAFSDMIYGYIYIYMGDMGIKRYQHTVGMGHNLVCIMCQSFSGQKGLDKYSNKYDQYICHYTHKQYWFSNVLRAWFWPIGPMQFGPAPFYPAPRSWWTADSRCPIEPDPVNGLILSGQS